MQAHKVEYLFEMVLGAKDTGNRLTIPSDEVEALILPFFTVEEEDLIEEGKTVDFPVFCMEEQLPMIWKIRCLTIKHQQQYVLFKGWKKYCTKKDIQPGDFLDFSRDHKLKSFCIKHTKHPRRVNACDGGGENMENSLQLALRNVDVSKNNELTPDEYEAAVEILKVKYASKIGLESNPPRHASKESRDQEEKMAGLGSDLALFNTNVSFQGKMVSGHHLDLVNANDSIDHVANSSVVDGKVPLPVQVATVSHMAAISQFNAHMPTPPQDMTYGFHGVPRVALTDVHNGHLVDVGAGMQDFGGAQDATNMIIEGLGSIPDGNIDTETYLKVAVESNPDENIGTKAYHKVGVESTPHDNIGTETCHKVAIESIPIPDENIGNESCQKVVIESCQKVVIESFDREEYHKVVAEEIANADDAMPMDDVSHNYNVCENAVSFSLNPTSSLEAANGSMESDEVNITYGSIKMNILPQDMNNVEEEELIDLNAMPNDD